MDYELIKKIPNKYGLFPKDIKRLRVLDWGKLKEVTWYNTNMLSGSCWCYICGCNSSSEKYDDFSEFWVGFYEDGRVDYHFSTLGGMCEYAINGFYNIDDIKDRMDIQVQANALRYLNKILDERIVSLDE